MSANYESAANEMVRRIEALAATRPEVLTLDDPWKLFDLGLKVDDLQPTYAMAAIALRVVQGRRPA